MDCGFQREELMRLISVLIIVYYLPVLVYTLELALDTMSMLKFCFPTTLCLKNDSKFPLLVMQTSSKFWWMYLYQYVLELFIRLRRCLTVKSNAMVDPVSLYARKMMSHLLFQNTRIHTTLLRLMVKFHDCISASTCRPSAVFHYRTH